MSNRVTLKEARAKRGLSQSVLARQSGVWPETISRIERGASTGSPLVRRALALALGMLSQDIEWPVPSLTR